MALTAAEAALLNKSDATRQRTELGTEVYNQQVIDAATPRVIQFAVVADATSGLTITVPFAMKIFDVFVTCTAANGSGTLTLRSSTNAITDAIVCAVDTTVVRAGTIDDAYDDITTATSLNVISNGAADRGIITILGFPA